MGVYLGMCSFRILVFLWVFLDCWMPLQFKVPFKAPFKAILGGLKFLHLPLTLTLEKWLRVDTKG